MPRWWIIPLAVALAGCTMAQRPAPPTPFPTATTVSSVPATLPPTPERVMALVQAATPTPTDAPPQASAPPATQTPTATATEAVTACAPGDVNPAQHQVAATVDYTSKVVFAQQAITYTNLTGDPLTQLVLNVEPNRWLDVFTLNSLMLDGTAPAYDLTGRRLTVTLPEPLNPDCAASLTLDFALKMPPVIGGVEAFRGYFGFTQRQINLGHWLPTVVPYVDGEWLHHPTVFVGEQIVLDRADWDVTLTLNNAPPETVIAAPGTVTDLGDQTWQFIHMDAREFAASVSHLFRKSTAQTFTGVDVVAYSLPDAAYLDAATGEWVYGGDYAAQVTAESLELFSERFGVYPHSRMVIVQGDFPDGMEFSGFAFVSTDWFVSYEGSPQSYLMLITVHEVAHQWWYDVVGNDQAMAPWLDEALSTYSEYIYIERHYPDLKDWWWWFRVNRLNPEGRVDSTVYEFDAIRPYINAVYLRGVLMLHDMRTTLGDAAFYAWLRRYAEANTGQVVTADDLWASLTDEQFAQTAVTRTAFLRNVGVMP